MNNAERPLKTNFKLLKDTERHSSTLKDNKRHILQRVNCRRTGGTATRCPRARRTRCTPCWSASSTPRLTTTTSSGSTASRSAPGAALHSSPALHPSTDTSCMTKLLSRHILETKQAHCTPRTAHHPLSPQAVRGGGAEVGDNPGHVPPGVPPRHQVKHLTSSPQLTSFPHLTSPPNTSPHPLASPHPHT